MEEEARSPAKTALPPILLAAVVQGWALYGLHHAITHHHWPATDQAWFNALYVLAVFIPVTVQLLAEHARAAALWRLVAVLAGAYCYFGWHFGASVAIGGAAPFRGTEGSFPFAFLLTVLWLMVLPFVQTRLTAGHWAIRYGALFADSWRNTLVLGEAALFTGLFWLLLLLWQMLFHLLGIDYFRELFEEAIFVYPVTSLTFGCALHLIGSIERLTSVVLEQILNVLKWLGLLAGIILAFFTIALVFKLPALLFTGQKAIGAVWLLWLTAVVVLLLNAAYRDGSVSQPYPRWIAQFLRVVVPLTVIVTLTALYALLMRTQHYGLTVERVWAFVVAGAALLYSVGYTLSAFGRGAWLGGMARVNVAVAVALIAVISAALTPLLSPYRLAADSQYRIVLAKGLELDDKGGAKNPSLWNTPLHYLRFDSGRYGRAKLEELARSTSGPRAEHIRRLAQEALAQKVRWEVLPVAEISVDLAKLQIYPAGRTLDRNLSDELIADLRRPENGFAYLRLEDEGVAGIYIDLNGDKSDEFVFLAATGGLVYENRAGRWVLVGSINRQSSRPGTQDFAGVKVDLIGELSKGNFSATTPKWNELSIGGHVFRVIPHEPASEEVPGALSP